MKQPGWLVFVIPMVLYLSTNVLFKVLWDKQPFHLELIRSSFISAAVSGAVTWFFAYRRYAKNLF